MSGSITQSLTGSQCENVSFRLKTSVYYDNFTDKFEDLIFLDSGCNYSIATTKKLNHGTHNDSINYYYDITDVKGNIVIPKKIID